MAILRSTTNFFARGNSAVEVLPNPPLEPALVDTYQVRLWAADRLIYERVQSVRDWQMRHFYVELLAHACCSTAVLFDNEITVSGNEANDSPTYLSLANAVIDIKWLTVSLSAARTKRGNFVHVTAYAEVDEVSVGAPPTPPFDSWSMYQSLLGIKLTCTPDDARAFGQQLLAELHEVERERIARGIPPAAEVF
jgi:hypothetical protein